MMAAAVGISEASVRRLWHAHGLKPHLVETFKISNDPQFAERHESARALCSAWMRRARFRRWIAHNLAFPSSEVVARP
jgi:hypothetical protein